MAKEQEQTESTATDSPTTEEAFEKASDAIEAEQAEKASTEESTSAEDEAVDSEVSETETETDASAEAEKETETEEAEDDAETLSRIDDDVLDVMRDSYDDVEIADLARNRPELLSDIREELDDTEKPAEKPADEEKPADKTVKEELEELQFKLDADVVGPEIKDAIDAIAARVNAQDKKMSEQDKGMAEQTSRLQAERDEAFNVRIDSCFDKHAKALDAEAKKTGEKPVLNLGNSETFAGKSYKQLTRAERRQQNRRTEIFVHAQVTSTLRRIPIEKAIEVEVERHNQGGPKAAEQKLLNKLERAKKRHTNKPTRRLSKATTAKYEDEVDEADAKMKAAEIEAGLVE